MLVAQGAIILLKSYKITRNSLVSLEEFRSVDQQQMLINFHHSSFNIQRISIFDDTTHMGLWFIFIHNRRTYIYITDLPMHVDVWFTICVMATMAIPSSISECNSFHFPLGYTNFLI